METERIIITELIVEIPDENDPLGYLQGYSLDTVFTVVFVSECDLTTSSNCFLLTVGCCSVVLASSQRAVLAKDTKEFKLDIKDKTR